MGLGVWAPLMHERTGALATFETDQDALDAGYTPLSSYETKKNRQGKLMKQLTGMNRHERRAWAAQQRRAK